VKPVLCTGVSVNIGLGVGEKEKAYGGERWGGKSKEAQ